MLPTGMETSRDDNSKAIKSRKRSTLKRVKEKMNTKKQYGYSIGHLTEDQIMRILEDVMTIMNNKKTTYILYVEKRFERTNTGVIQDYVTERIFKISIDDTTSTARRIKAGASQGTGLSQVL